MQAISISTTLLLFTHGVNTIKLRGMMALNSHYNIKQICLKHNNQNILYLITNSFSLFGPKSVFLVFDLFTMNNKGL